MTSDKVIPYKGSEPYIFISYAHADSKRVMILLERLQIDGYRIWYDNGIEVGKDWATYIVRHLKNAACMIAFISNQYIVSENCIDEIEYSKNEKIPTLIIYLEDIDQPEWMKLRHGRTQTISCKQYGMGYRLFERIYEAEILASCKTGNTKIQKNRQGYYDLKISSRYNVQQDTVLPQWYAVYLLCINTYKTIKNNTVLEKALNLPFWPEEKDLSSVALDFAQKYASYPISSKDVVRVQEERINIELGKKNYFIRKKLDTIQIDGKTIDIYDVISSDLVKVLSDLSSMKDGLSVTDTGENYLYGVVRKSYLEQPEIVFLREARDGSLKQVEDPLEFQQIFMSYSQLRFLGFIPSVFQNQYKKIQEISIRQNFDLYLEYMETTYMDLFHQLFDNSEGMSPDFVEDMMKNTYIDISNNLRKLANEKNKIICDHILGWYSKGPLSKKIPIEITSSSYQLRVIDIEDKRDPFAERLFVRDNRYPVKTIVTPLDTVYTYPKINNLLIGYTVVDIVKSLFSTDTYYLLAYPQKKHCVDKLEKRLVYFVVERDSQYNLSIKHFLPSDKANENMAFKYIYERFALIAAQTEFFCSWVFDDTKII